MWLWFGFFVVLESVKCGVLGGLLSSTEINRQKNEVTLASKD